MSVTLHAYNVDQLSTVQKDAVRALLLKSYAQYEPLYTDPQVWTTYAADIHAAVDHPHVDKFITAQIDERFVGVVLLFKGGEKAYNRPELHLESHVIRFLAVDPIERGKKIAEQLIQESFKWIGEQGGDELVLHTSDKMQSAIKLYERMGFERAPQYEYALGDTYVKSYRIAIAITT
ncbi:MAG: GNAT family N-acetyltransferase [Solibacillus sp.]